MPGCGTSPITLICGAPVRASEVNSSRNLLMALVGLEYWSAAGRNVTPETSPTASRTSFSLASAHDTTVGSPASSPSRTNGPANDTNSSSEP